jgi:hypothetical protein
MNNDICRDDRRRVQAPIEGGVRAFDEPTLAGCIEPTGHDTYLKRDDRQPGGFVSHEYGIDRINAAGRLSLPIDARKIVIHCSHLCVSELALRQ